MSAGVDVSLVTMPYASLPRPSLALGLLKSILEAAGVATSVEYANMWFADAIGIRCFHLCSHQCPTEFLAGEWTFAEAAFRGEQPDDDGFLRAVMTCHASVLGYRAPGGARRLRSDLLRIRHAATRFVDEAALRVLDKKPRIVGCTSTFEQHVASLALLRRIKEIDPAIVTMMGGANCEAEMGRATHRCFPWVEYVISGEADGLVVGLVSRLLSKGAPDREEELPTGVFGPPHRAKLPIWGENGEPARAVFRDVDSLPLPQFSEYFSQLDESSLKPAITPALPLETSRGCWWGAVHHCTFCGLNGNGMVYRSKSPDRVVRELESLQAEYNVSRFESVDNILEHKYFQTLLPRLAQCGAQRRIFYEIKSNLTRQQVRALKEAAITWVQPGIESLHSAVLRLMDKGVQGWQNVQLLKWAREFGVRLSWSILWGFPGEQDDWYREMAEWIPALEHLQPPAGLHRLRYDRFSVYHNQARQLGLRLSPISAMRFVYPLQERDLRELAYFFVEREDLDTFQWLYGNRRAELLQPGRKAVFKAVDKWKTMFKRELTPILSMSERNNRLEVFDSRSFATEFRLTFDGLERAICLACNDAPLRERLAQILNKQFSIEAGENFLDSSLNELIARRIILPLDGRLITVAVHGDIPKLPGLDEFPGGFVRSAPITARQREYLGIAEGRL